MWISRKAAALPSAVAVSPGMDGEVAGRDRRRPALARWRPGLITALLLALAGAVLFLCYLRQSWTLSLNSDGAADILQARDMLHGNVLLHGWQLSQVSFWSTELPQYMLLESVMGVSVAVVHVAGAMTCTLLVLLSALLAKGRATGREAIVRMLVAGGIMLAPQLGPGTAIFMLSPRSCGDRRAASGHLAGGGPAGRPALVDAGDRGSPARLGAAGRPAGVVGGRGAACRGVRGPGLSPAGGGTPAPCVSPARPGACRGSGAGHPGSIGGVQRMTSVLASPESPLFATRSHVTGTRWSPGRCRRVRCCGGGTRGPRPGRRCWPRRRRC